MADDPVTHPRKVEVFGTVERCGNDTLPCGAEARQVVAASVVRGFEVFAAIGFRGAGDARASGRVAYGVALAVAVDLTGGAEGEAG